MRFKITSVGFGGSLEPFMRGLKNYNIFGENTLLDTLEIADKFLSFSKGIELPKVASPKIGFIDGYEDDIEIIVSNKNEDYIEFKIDDGTDEDYQYILNLIKDGSNLNVKVKKY